MADPVVTIVMPSLQKGAYIGRALDSVLRQEVPLQLVVQDACSTDETRDVLERVATDARVEVHVEHDEGQADAINRGFARARGDILGWLNADDELEPGALEVVVDALRSPSCRLVYGRGHYVDADGRPGKPYNVLPFDRRLLLTRDYVLQPASFWRRELWEQVGPLDTTLTWAFDWDWYVRASRVTDFCLVDAQLARYRLTPEMKTLSGGSERQAELAAVARRHGGRRQPTYVYWQFCRLTRALPPLRVLEPLLWRLYAGRIGT